MQYYIKKEEFMYAVIDTYIEQPIASFASSEDAHKFIQLLFRLPEEKEPLAIIEEQFPGTMEMNFQENITAEMPTEASIGGRSKNPNSSQKYSFKNEAIDENYIRLIVAEMQRDVLIQEKAIKEREQIYAIADSANKRIGTNDETEALLKLLIQEKKNKQNSNISKTLKKLYEDEETAETIVNKEASNIEQNLQSEKSKSKNFEHNLKSDQEKDDKNIYQKKQSKGNDFDFFREQEKKSLKKQSDMPNQEELIEAEFEKYSKQVKENEAKKKLEELKSQLEMREKELLMAKQKLSNVSKKQYEDKEEIKRETGNKSQIKIDTIEEVISEYLSTSSNKNNPIDKRETQNNVEDIPAKAGSFTSNKNEMKSSVEEQNRDQKIKENSRNGFDKRETNSREISKNDLSENKNLRDSRVVSELQDEIARMMERENFGEQLTSRLQQETKNSGLENSSNDSFNKNKNENSNGFDNQTNLSDRTSPISNHKLRNDDKNSSDHKENFESSSNKNNTHNSYSKNNSSYDDKYSNEQNGFESNSQNKNNFNHEENNSKTKSDKENSVLTNLSNDSFNKNKNEDSNGFDNQTNLSDRTSPISNHELRNDDKNFSNQNFVDKNTWLSDYESNQQKNRQNLDSELKTSKYPNNDNSRRENSSLRNGSLNKTGGINYDNEFRNQDSFESEDVAYRQQNVRETLVDNQNSQNQQLHNNQNKKEGYQNYDSYDSRARHFGDDYNGERFSNNSHNNENIEEWFDQNQKSRKNDYHNNRDEKFQSQKEWNNYPDESIYNNENGYQNKVDYDKFDSASQKTFRQTEEQKEEKRNFDNRNFTYEDSKNQSRNKDENKYSENNPRTNRAEKNSNEKFNQEDFVNSNDKHPKNENYFDKYDSKNYSDQDFKNFEDKQIEQTEYQYPDKYVDNGLETNNYEKNKYNQNYDEQSSKEGGHYLQNAKKYQEELDDKRNYNNQSQDQEENFENIENNEPWTQKWREIQEDFDNNEARSDFENLRNEHQNKLDDIYSEQNTTQSTTNDWDKNQEIIRNKISQGKSANLPYGYDEEHDKTLFGDQMLFGGIMLYNNNTDDDSLGEVAAYASRKKINTKEDFQNVEKTQKIEPKYESPKIDMGHIQALNDFVEPEIPSSFFEENFDSGYKMRNIVTEEKKPTVSQRSSVSSSEIIDLGPIEEDNLPSIREPSKEDVEKLTKSELKTLNKIRKAKERERKRKI